MMAKYEIVELFALNLCNDWLTYLQFSSKSVCTDSVSIQRN